MTYYNKSILPSLLIATLSVWTSNNITAQQPISNNYDNSLLKHGIEQFNAKLYVQSLNTLGKYLKTNFLPTQHDELMESNADYRQAQYYYIISNIKAGVYGATDLAKNYLNKCPDAVYRQRTAFALAQYLFRQNDFAQATEYYEQAGIANLTNEEISDAKFELAYCYFYNNRLEESKNLFAAITNIHDHKYYVPGNYYYGLLALNDKEYSKALKSFEAISNEPEYHEVLPYYKAEIHYFLGNKAQLKSLSNSYLANDSFTIYKKEMHLLRAQLLFEEEKYKEALPDFVYVINNSDKLKKEVYYEIGYTHYKLKQWNDAITAFKELSIADDSLGQTAMYLLGNCFMQVNDKDGARNAFGLATEMDYIPSIKEAATFLYAKLSYEKGNEIVATRKFNEYVNNYPGGESINEAKSLLSSLLLKNSNFEEAYKIISTSDLQDNFIRDIYQKVTVGRAVQLIIDKDYTQAYIMLNNSLEHNINREYEAIARFWKAELEYNKGDYKNAIVNANAFLDLNQTYSHIIQRLSTNANKQNANLIIGFAEMELSNYTAAQNAFTQAQKSEAGNDNSTAAMATLNAADAAFMNKDYAQADLLYKHAVLKGVSDKEYALYQRALIAGLNNNEKEKEDYLNTLIRSSNSSYKDAALLELATMQIQKNEFSDAAISLQKVMNNTDDVKLKANATYKMAFVYQSLNQKEKAKETYQAFIKDYPTNADRNSAMESLRILYTQDSDFDSYLKYAKDNNLPEPDEFTKQQAYFDIIETAFEQQDWKSVIDKSEQFENSYPNSQYTVPAIYYRAEAQRISQQPYNAISNYKLVIDNGWNAYTEDAYKKLGSIYLNRKEFNNAIIYYGNLMDKTSNQALKNEAIIGVMQGHYGNNDLATAEKLADIVVEIKDANKYDVATAHLIKAKNAIDKEDWNTALSNLNTVSTQNLGMLTAESRYLSALVLQKQGKLDAAVTTAEKAIKTSNQYQYWVAKNFMLIAAVMLEQKDYFEANAIMEELKKGVQDEALQPEIDALYNEVKAAQLSNSKIIE